MAGNFFMATLIAFWSYLIICFILHREMNVALKQVLLKKFLVQYFLIA